MVPCVSGPKRPQDRVSVSELKEDFQKCLDNPVRRGGGERGREGEEGEERKKMTIFNFFKVRFLGFYKAERKSEDIFVLRRVRAFHRYPFC